MLKCIRIKTILSICVAVVLSSHLISPNGMATDRMESELKFIDMEYNDYDPSAEGGISYTYQNTTNMMLCIPYHEFITTESGAANLWIINTATLKEVEFNGPIADRILWPYFVMIVPPKKVVKGFVPLNKFYELQTGKYRIRHFSHAISCSHFTENNTPRTSFLITDRVKNGEKIEDYWMKKNPGVIFKLDAIINVK